MTFILVRKTANKNIFLNKETPHGNKCSEEIHQSDVVEQEWEEQMARSLYRLGGWGKSSCVGHMMLRKTMDRHWTCPALGPDEFLSVMPRFPLWHKQTWHFKMTGTMRES